MAVKKKSRSKGGTTVNFSGVESGGRKCPDGEYVAEVVASEVEESSAGNPMISLQWKITEGKFKGTKIYDNISLMPNALWKLKTLLEAVEVDPQEEDVEASEYASELMEKTATIIVTNETYEGEQRPKVTGYGTGEASEESDDGDSDDDDADDEEEDKKPAKKGAKKASSKKDEEEDDDDDDEEEEEEEEEPKVRNKAKGGKTSKLKEGSRVKFTDDDDNLIKGTIIALDGDTATVEDKDGSEYEIDVEHLTAL